MCGHRERRSPANDADDSQQFRDPHHGHTAYLPYDITKRIIWDPTAMEIVDVMEDSSLQLQKDSLELTYGGNRNSVRYDGPVLQVFFYHDSDWVHYGDESMVAA